MTIACHSQHNRRAQRTLRGLFLACLAGFICSDSKGVSVFKMLWAHGHIVHCKSTCAGDELKISPGNKSSRSRLGTDHLISYMVNFTHWQEGDFLSTSITWTYFKTLGNVCCPDGLNSFTLQWRVCNTTGELPKQILHGKISHPFPAWMERECGKPGLAPQHFWNGLGIQEEISKVGGKHSSGPSSSFSSFFFLQD